MWQLGLCSGLAHASDHFKACPNEKFQQYVDNKFDKATHSVYDPASAEHMKLPQGFTEQDMTACGERYKYQTYNEAKNLRKQPDKKPTEG